MAKTLDELFKESLNKRYGTDVSSEPEIPIAVEPTQEKLPEKPPQEEPEEELTEVKLSEYDLAGSDVYDDVIIPYMEARNRSDYSSTDKEEVVSMFMNNMRGFSGGNTVRAGKELSWLAGASEEDRVKAGAAYSFLEKDMADLYSKDTTLAEKASGTWDYVRQGFLDPINIVGGFAGKLAGGATFRLGNAAARKAAINEFRRQMSKGVTEEVANKAADKVFIKSSVEANQALAKRAVQNNTTTTVIKNLTTKSGLAEIGAATTVDIASGMLTDVGYQTALLKTGAQEEYNSMQTFLSGAFSLGAGGIAATTVGLKGLSGLKLASEATPDPTTTGIGKELKNSIEFLSREGNSWDKKVIAGRSLDEISDQAFFALIKGDDDGNWKGLAEIFAERNLFFTDPDMYENKSDWITDTILNMPQTESEDFIQALKDLTGITKATKGKELTLETFGEVFARKASDIGRNLGVIADVGSVMKKKNGSSDLTKVTLIDYAEELGLTIEAKKKKPLMSSGATDLQNNLIRGIVSNLGTTSLNVRGWKVATMTNSATDLVQAQMLALTGNTRAASHLIAMQGQKIRNLVDNNTTLEVFLNYLDTRPDVGRAMSREISGGVEQRLSFDFNKSFGNQKFTEFVDGVQAVNMVYAQDTMTKAQEFMYQLDKNIRLYMDMSYSDLMTRPDAFELMQSPDYKKLEIKAIDETERAVFSRSFQDSDLLGVSDLARLIERTRNVPGIGYLAPFGKFFNNTVSNISDHTGITLAVRAIKRNETDTTKARTNQELFARGLVTATAVGFMVPKEIENIENGLDVFETVDESTGEVVTYQFDFPVSYIKAMARWKAKSHLNQDLSESEIKVIRDTLGLNQLTRQLENTGSNAADLWNAIFRSKDPNSDAKPVTEVISEIGYGMAGLASSGLTRTFEPVNAAIGLTLGEAYVNIDKKQGNRLLNESLKYLDQVYAVMAGEPLAPQKFSAVEGTRDVDVGKFAGSRVIKMNSTKRVLNLAGINDWTVEGQSSVAIANNEFNRAFNSMAEYHSKKLLLNPKFKQGTPEIKRRMAQLMFNDMRKSTKEYMSMGLNATGNPELGLMYKIMSSNKRKVRAVLEILTEKPGYPDSVEDFNLEQLNTLDAMVSSYESWLDR